MSEPSQVSGERWNPEGVWYLISRVWSGFWITMLTLAVLAVCVYAWLGHK